MRGRTTCRPPLAKKGRLTIGTALLQPNSPCRWECIFSKDAGRKVVYVGKAKSQRNRVRSYFLEDKLADIKTGTLIAEARCRLHPGRQLKRGAGARKQLHQVQDTLQDPPARHHLNQIQESLAPSSGVLVRNP